MNTFDPPLPWEVAEDYAAQQRCYALMDRAVAATLDDDGKPDRVAALAWLSRTVADDDTKADALGCLAGQLDEAEGATYLAWRTGAPAALVRVAMGRHSRRHGRKVAA